MTGEAILTVAAAVVGLVQLLKWSGYVSGRMAPLAVFISALFGVLLWGWAMNALSRETAFDFFAGWISVSTSAAGVFGLVRESAAAVTAMRKEGGTNGS